MEKPESVKAIPVKLSQASITRSSRTEPPAVLVLTPLLKRALDIVSEGKKASRPSETPVT